MDENSREYVARNRDHWDELAEHHPDTDHYDVESFLDGESTLRSIEQSELDAGGRRMLHLQCHIGLDTLSWVRDGGVARATGVDFSETAIETARELRDRVGIDPERAKFVESDVYDLPAVLDETFDLVFTSYGTIYWLPDLSRWAEVIAHHLEPGGTFYIVDGHPFVAPFGEGSTAEDLELRYPYFNEEPVTVEFDGSYAGQDFGMEHPTSHGFAHPLGEVVTELSAAGLRIEFVHEHPWSFFQRFEAMERDGEGRWRMPGLDFDLPCTFSLSATIPE